MPGLFRKLFTPSLRSQLEDGVRTALHRYADRRIAPDLRVYVTADLVPGDMDPDLWARDEGEHLHAFASQWAQDNGIGRGTLNLEVVLLETKREFAFVKTIGLEQRDGEARLVPEAPAPETAVLVVVESPTLRDPLRVTGETVLGRRTAEGVTGTDDRYMSARHIRLRVGDGQLEVTDLGSRNQTYLNGDPIPPNEPRVMQEGNTLRMGNTVLRFDRIGKQG